MPALMTHTDIQNALRSLNADEPTRWHQHDNAWLAEWVFADFLQAGVSAVDHARCRRIDATGCGVGAGHEPDQPFAGVA